MIKEKSKLVWNKLYIYIILGFLPIVFLADLKINEFNIWMDYGGILSLLDNFSHFFSVWNNNILGSFSFTTPASLPFLMCLKVIFEIFGLDYGTYFVFYFFILFIGISGFILSDIILRNKKHAILIVPIFIFNPVILYYTFARGTITFLMAFSGLLIIYYFMYKYKLSNEKKYLLGIIFASLLVAHPFIFFFLLFVIFYYFFINKKFKEILIVNIFILLINSFWIIPFLSSFLFRSNKLLGSYSTDLVATYANLGSFSYSFIFLGRSFSLLGQIFSNYYYIYLIIFFFLWIFVIYFSLFVKQKVDIKYWPLILILLLFSIGPRGELGVIYRYFLENFQFFSFFRSYQNIFIIILSLLLFYSLIIAKNNKYFLRILQGISLITFFSFILLRNTDFTSKSVQIPIDYFKVKEIVDMDDSDNKVFLLPLSIYDFYKWDKNQDKYFLQYFFKNKGLIFFRPTIDNNFLKSFYDNLYQNNIALDANDFRLLGVKYILDRKDLNYIEKGYFQENTFKIPGELLLKTENLDLYLIDDPDPIIQLDNSYFKMVNQFEYKIYAKEVLMKKELLFLHQFHDGWKIYVEPISDNNYCNEPKFYQRTKVEECLSDSKLFDGKGLSYLWEKSVFEDTHKVVHDYANQWNINSEYIKNNLSKDYYKENPDGSIDINLTLYFKPQSYFYLGLVISGATLLGALVYLGHDFVKRRKTRWGVEEDNNKEIKKD